MEIISFYVFKYIFILHMEIIPETKQNIIFPLLENNNCVKSVEVFSVDSFFPDGRVYSTAEVIDDCDIFLHGGTNKKKEYNDINIFDMEEMRWKSIVDVSTANPFFIFDKTFSGHSSSLINHEGSQKIFLYGGFDGKTYSNAIYLIESDNFCFSQVDVRAKIGAEYPQARNYHTSNYDSESSAVYIYGGWNGNVASAFNQNFESVWKFCLKSK
jgi:hypothetical protein